MQFSPLGCYCRIFCRSKLRRVFPYSQSNEKGRCRSISRILIYYPHQTMKNYNTIIFILECTISVSSGEENGITRMDADYAAFLFFKRNPSLFCLCLLVEDAVRCHSVPKKAPDPAWQHQVPCRVRRENFPTSVIVMTFALINCNQIPAHTVNEAVCLIDAAAPHSALVFL